MPTVFFLPGISGSQLLKASDTTDVLWVDYSLLAFQGLGVFPLDEDGVTPKPPCGLAIVAGEPLDSFYGIFLSALQRRLPAGYTLIPWGYDWRKDLLTTGQQLASVIEALPASSLPAIIVGHSAGGLVARVAWSHLVADNQTARVSRIITMGTPHQGSYSMVELFSGADSTFMAIVTLVTIANAILGAIPGPTPPCAAVGLYNNLEIVFTFPAVYELLPLLALPIERMIPIGQRSIRQVIGNRHSPQQRWLDNAKGPWATLMNSAASVPPPGFTTIAGTGVNTPDVLTYPAQLGRTSAYYFNLEADNSVPVHSALVPGSVQYVIPSAHNDIPMATINTGILLAEITTVRNADQTPVPPEEAIDAPLVQTIGGVPLR